MTVMPLVAAPTTPLAAAGTAPAPDGTVAADFAALVDQALAAGDPVTVDPRVAGAQPTGAQAGGPAASESQLGDLPTPPSVEPTSLPAPLTSLPTPPTSRPTALTSLPTPLTTLPTAPSLLATTGSSSHPPVTGLPPVTPDDEPEPATPDAPAPGTAGSVPVVGLPVLPVLPVAVDAAAPVPPATSSPTSPVRGADSPTPLPGVGPASSADAPAPSDRTPAPSDRAPARAPADSPLPAASAPVASPAPATLPAAGPDPTMTSVAPLATSVVTSVAAPVAAPMVTTTTTAPPAAVTAQVFPEVTRLVSTGNGTHRVTLQLNPAALGEVRVTLTVRAGVVRVSLAASSEAQASLLHGAPELRRLLELTGASDTRIVVRDLPSGAAPVTAPPPASTDTGTGAFGQPGSGQVGHGGDRSQDQHAGTRDGATNARDGDHDEAVRPRPIDPTTRTRTSGVDVTM